jgi:hypothetical protein
MSSVHAGHEDYQQQPVLGRSVDQSRCAWCVDAGRVGSHVDSTDVVTIHQCSAAKRGVELQEELAQPCSFCNSISHSAILSFSTKPRDGVLTLGGPGDEVVTKEHSIARGGILSRTKCHAGMHSLHKVGARATA